MRFAFVQRTIIKFVSLMSSARTRLVSMLAVTLTALASTQTIPEGPRLPAEIGGSLHHSIRTGSAEAQTLFDQGLTLFYGFNRDGARRSFLRAAAIDPLAPMPHVGIALAAGPNLNSDPTPAEIKEGCAAARKGSALAQQADEKAYSEALVTRYCAGLTFATATAYAVAMGELFQQFPADPDAATLYADSLISLRPRSAEQSAELVAVLELVLGKWPKHVGANHYYIHAVEGSRTPERGWPSAERLETLGISVGHLLHMPSHIYSRMGDHSRAILVNERAVTADVAYLRANGFEGDQATSYHHNLESLAVAAGYAGRYAVALRAGSAAAETPLTGHGAVARSKGSTFSPIHAFVLLRFNRSQEVLRLSPPATTELPNRLWYHFVRSVAHAQLHRAPLAATERDHFERQVREIPADAMYRQHPAARVMEVYTAILDARLANVRGDHAAAVRGWERAVSAQDRLVYHEPPPVYYSVRESLGAALFQHGDLARAESVFREDLVRHPRNGRSLFGLWQTMSALGRREDADAAKRMFEDAWTGSDTTLSLGDY